MFQKPFDQSECGILWIAISPKQAYVWTWVISRGSGQEYFGVPKVMPNSESALSQEWVEQLFLRFLMDSKKLQICLIISNGYGQACGNFLKPVS